MAHTPMQTVQTEFLEQLKAALRYGGITQADILHALHDAGETVACNEYVERARRQASDDLEIDDYPLVSRGDDGVWVSAWVWIDDEPETTPAKW